MQVAPVSGGIGRPGCVATCRSDKLGHVTNDLAGLRRAYDRADKVTRQRRAELAEAIADAIRGGMRIVEIARITGYDREHIRRIARAQGIEAAPRGKAATLPPA